MKICECKHIIKNIFKFVSLNGKLHTEKLSILNLVLNVSQKLLDGISDI